MAYAQSDIIQEWIGFFEKSGINPWVQKKDCILRRQFAALTGLSGKEFGHLHGANRFASECTSKLQGIELRRFLLQQFLCIPYIEGDLNKLESTAVVKRESYCPIPLRNVCLHKDDDKTLSERLQVLNCTF